MQELKKDWRLASHIVFYAKIAEEKQIFDIADVIDSLCKKLIFRHPHVFGDVTVENSTQVTENWEALKLKEKAKKRVLEGVPQALPALVKANRIQDKARGVGFDWEKREQVWDKVKEEFEEFEVEMKAGNKATGKKNWRPSLFNLVNAARLYKIDPESALSDPI
jgi:XTP/dITP diphosphohydrolase